MDVMDPIENNIIEQIVGKPSANGFKSDFLIRSADNIEYQLFKLCLVIDGRIRAVYELLRFSRIDSCADYGRRRWIG